MRVRGEGYPILAEISSGGVSNISWSFVLGGYRISAGISLLCKWKGISNMSWSQLGYRILAGASLRGILNISWDLEGLSGRGKFRFTRPVFPSGREIKHCSTSFPFCMGKIKFFSTSCSFWGGN